ncbi:MAG TPA: zf-TFIIB domain-containing protein, partial [Candidatus Polarisedimenticolaceae bacterium]|nr:zf-TFIIB domain-containing protein [Candidatus Polarisedimenticolaceae bacterium]
RCPRRLRRFDLGGEQPLELDRCPAGHGLWLDRGELRAVLEACGEGEAGAVASFFADLYRSELDVDSMRRS